MRLLRKPAYLGLAWLALVCATPGRSSEMRFSTTPYGKGCEPDCPRLIQAVGPITPNTPQAFLDFARDQTRRPGLMNVVLIHSPGGSVNASIRLGRILRQLGAVVIVARAMENEGAPSRRGGARQATARFVSASCTSACVYTLAGGSRRIVPPESRVAVHRMAGNISSFDVLTRDATQQRVYAGPRELATLTAYIQEMGVSADLVSIAEDVPHESARVLTTREMAKLNLASPRL
jgi:hypothetical protein